jgi:hypothetical protein
VLQRGRVRVTSAVLNTVHLACVSFSQLPVKLTHSCVSHVVVFVPDIFKDALSTTDFVVSNEM